MSDFAKKATKIAAAVVFIFVILYGLHYAAKNEFKLSAEVTLALQAVVLAAIGWIGLQFKPTPLAAAIITATVLAGAGEVQAGPFGFFNRFTGPTQSACANGQCSSPQQPAVSQPATTTTKEAKAAVAAPAVEQKSALPPTPQASAAGTFGASASSATAAGPVLNRDRERRIAALSRDGRAVFRRLQSDPAFRAKVAAEWNKTYAEKISPDDLDNWLAVIVKWLPYLLEIIFKLI